MHETHTIAAQPSTSLSMSALIVKGEITAVIGDEASLMEDAIIRENRCSRIRQNRTRPL